MTITPQDIIDKEFRVKFRGFDMVEVDTFLEDVAEIFFKLTEENTLLNEKIAALQKDIGSGSKVVSQGQLELPAELSNFLEELKQDTAVLSAELVAIKQDHSAIASLEKNMKGAIASLMKAGPVKLSQEPPDIPADLASTLEEFRQERALMGEELAALKQELGSIGQIRNEIKDEMQELLKSHFDSLEAKLSQSATVAKPKPKTKPPAKKKETLVAAIIKEAEDEDTRLPDFEEQGDTAYEGGLDFSSEEDILDEDKLRDVFQSVLDDSVSDTDDNRDGDDSSSDLLFLEDSIIEDEHEPEVTFSLDEETVDSKPAKKKKKKK
jgi:DivIVA domain-containing protein